jgi:hypothetical protein
MYQELQIIPNTHRPLKLYCCGGRWLNTLANVVITLVKEPSSVCLSVCALKLRLSYYNIKNGYISHMKNVKTVGMII